MGSLQYSKCKYPYDFYIRFFRLVNVKELFANTNDNANTIEINNQIKIIKTVKYKLKIGYK